ncbi:hypothetical protein AB0I81_30120 [Nonomuraea sp. NPDC050404]|uniref:hypothetical protein n=1 Tax=Nonomuraea sp. NPDC050404 TaxID=3155783 RepID=UPI0034091121
MRTPLIFVVIGVLLGITAVAILIWILDADNDRAVQQTTPAPSGYLQASAH